MDRNRENIEKIYKLFFKDIFYFLFSISKDKELSEDLTSEVFIIFIDRMTEIDKDSSIKSWLFTVAKNEYLQYIRKKTNQEIDLDENYLNSLVKKDNLEEEIININLLENIGKYISKMDGEKRELFYYRELEGLSYKEIGERLNRNENWAAVTHYRLKKDIVNKFGRDYYD